MKKLVLCDLDKTIIDANYDLNSTIFPASVRAFQKSGGLIGLNSDTPLAKLLEHQQNWGMNGPTVAEMGGIVKFHKEFPIRKAEALWADFCRTVAGQLSDCASNYTTLLGDALVEQHGIKTIAFPCISTGACGFPMDRAARIAVRETGIFLERNQSVEKVILVCFGAGALEIYEAALREIFNSQPE